MNPLWRQIFYHSTITLLTPSAGEMRNGIYIEGEPTQKVIICDVQPSSRQITGTDYGDFVDAEYTVFSDVDPEIKTGKKVIYKGTEYTIYKLEDWNTYYRFSIKAVGL